MYICIKNYVNKWGKYKKHFATFRMAKMSEIILKNKQILNCKKKLKKNCISLE